MSVNIIITKTSTTKLTLSHSPDWVHLGVTFLGFEDKNVKRIVFSFKRTAVQVRSWNTPFHFCSTKPLACASPHHGSYADSFQSQTPASRILGASFCLLGIGTDLRLEKNACILLNSRKAAWEIGKTKNKKRFSEGCCHNAVCGPACVCVSVCESWCPPVLIIPILLPAPSPLPQNGWVYVKVSLFRQIPLLHI